MKATITLSADDTERLFAVKKIQGKDNKTAEEFLEELTHKMLYDLFPAIPEMDEAGNITNSQEYRAK